MAPSREWKINVRCAGCSGSRASAGLLTVIVDELLRIVMYNVYIIRNSVAQNSAVRNSGGLLRNSESDFRNTVIRNSVIRNSVIRNSGVYQCI